MLTNSCRARHSWSSSPQGRLRFPNVGRNDWETHSGSRIIPGHGIENVWRSDIAERGLAVLAQNQESRVDRPCARRRLARRARRRAPFRRSRTLQAHLSAAHRRDAPAPRRRRRGPAEPLPDAVDPFIQLQSFRQSVGGAGQYLFLRAADAAAAEFLAAVEGPLRSFRIGARQAQLQPGQASRRHVQLCRHRRQKNCRRASAARPESPPKRRGRRTARLYRSSFPAT